MRNPVSVRISTEERELLEAVAYYKGQALSDLIRCSAVSVAQDFAEREPPGVIMVAYRDMLARRERIL